MEKDEPLTPAGRLFVQPELEQIINCAISTKHQLDIEAVKAEVRGSIMLQHPRFCSLMVRDSRGREHWRRTEVDVDRHFVVFPNRLADYPEVSDEDAVNDYLADLSVSTPLDHDKPLWEIHLLMAHNCVVFRVHHALGDGISLMSMLLSCCRRADDPTQTINDVLFGVISCGLSKYLDIRSTKALPEGLRITGVAMVNLRPQRGLEDISKLMNSKTGMRWGNRFGVLLLPIYYHKGGVDPLQVVKRAKAMIDRKKQSLEAVCSYKLGNLVMSLLGAKFASLLNYRVVSNTTFTISNIIGSQEEITVIGNPVNYMRVNSSSLPHAITMHMLSYAGRADMQILVAKDIIPDPKVLAKCFEDSLLEMKEAAESAAKA